MVSQVLSFARVKRFTDYLFDRENRSGKVARILQAILEAHSPRLWEMAERMPGSPRANDKTIPRFLAETDPKGALQRLFHEQALFVLVDVTEIPRPQDRRTSIGKESPSEGEEMEPLLQRIRAAQAEDPGERPGILPAGCQGPGVLSTVGLRGCPKSSLRVRQLFS